MEMGEQVNEENHVILWRWAVAAPIISAIAAVTFGVINLVRTPGDNTSVAPTSESTGTTAPEESTGTTAPESDAPRKAIDQRVGTGPPPSNGETTVLGLDLLPLTMEDCHTPPLASGSTLQPGTVELDGRGFGSSYSCNLFSRGIRRSGLRIRRSIQRVDRDHRFPRKLRFPGS